MKKKQLKKLGYIGILWIVAMLSAILIKTTTVVIIAIVITIITADIYWKRLTNPVSFKDIKNK